MYEFVVFEEIVIYDVFFLLKNNNVCNGICNKNRGWNNGKNNVFEFLCEVKVFFVVLNCRVK